MPFPPPAEADPHPWGGWGSGAMPWQLGIISEFTMHLFCHKDRSRIYLLEEATMIGRPRDAAGTESTLVPMLIWGLVLVVVGMAFVMLFV